MAVHLFTTSVEGSGYGDAVSGLNLVLKMLEKEGMYSASPTIINLRLPIVQPHGADVGIFVIHPTQILSDPNLVTRIKTAASYCKKAYLSVVWETDALPDEWSRVFDSSIVHFDGFIAPSVFMYNHLKERTGKPVFYLPHYIEKRDIANYDHDSSTFRMLFVGQYTTRKGLNETITAATRTFYDYDDVELVIKYTQLSNNEAAIDDFIREIILCNSDPKSRPKFKLYVSAATYSSETMDTLYNSADILIFPSRGEGFGLPPCISMSMGIPVVYVPWSATQETCDHAHNYPVEYHMDEAHGMRHYGYTPGMKNAVPHLSSLMYQMKTAYNDFRSMAASDILARKKSLSEFIDSRYGADVLKECMKCLIMNNSDGIRRFPYTEPYILRG